MNHVFVTGGSGFVGRTLIRVLRERGYGVRAAVRSERAAETVRKAGAEPVDADLATPERMTQAMKGCAFAVHAAAKVEDFGRYDEFYEANVIGTENVLVAAKAARVPRLVHVSTEAVLLGGRPLFDADESWPLPAKQPGFYPRTKALAEQRVIAANTAELATVAVRPRLIWGKGDTSLLPKIVEIVKAGKFAWISHGRYPTSTCHVRNVAEGIILAGERGRAGQVYFLTDGAPVEFRDFLSAMLQTQGVDPGDRNLPRPLAHASAVVLEAIWKLLRLSSAPPITRTIVQLSGNQVTVSDRKARAELGYKEKITREQGLAEMAAQGPRE